MAQNTAPWRRRVWRWMPLFIVIAVAAGIAYGLFLAPIAVRKHVVARGEVEV